MAYTFSIPAGVLGDCGCCGLGDIDCADLEEFPLPQRLYMTIVDIAMPSYPQFAPALFYAQITTPIDLTTYGPGDGGADDASVGWSLGANDVPGQGGGSGYRKNVGPDLERCWDNYPIDQDPPDYCSEDDFRACVNAQNSEVWKHRHLPGFHEEIVCFDFASMGFIQSALHQTMTQVFVFSLKRFGRHPQISDLDPQPGGPRFCERFFQGIGGDTFITLPFGNFCQQVYANFRKTVRIVFQGQPHGSNYVDLRVHA